MRKLLIYILLFATLLPTVSPWGTIVDFHADRDYIVRVLCENRDKPQLHYNGKCYLVRKLTGSFPGYFYLHHTGLPITFSRPSASSPMRPFR